MDAKLFPRKKVDWVKIGKLIEQLSKKGKVWTGAYMIRAPKKKGAKKGKYVAETVVGKSLAAMLPELVKYFRTTPPSERSYQRVHCNVDAH